MVPKTKLAILAAALALPRDAFSLQVSPNSPCAASCLDSPSLDQSDPNSSNTRPSDMSCADADYQRSPGGIKWKSCMTCLEKSGYSQGSESDQGWYLCELFYTCLASNGLLPLGSSMLISRNRQHTVQLQLLHFWLPQQHRHRLEPLPNLEGVRSSRKSPPTRRLGLAAQGRLHVLQR